MPENIYQESLEFHQQYKGKISVELKVPLENTKDLSLAYTPGVAQPCLEIQKDKSKSYLYTAKSNLVAVITDGTAVLGLGDIGPEAAMPVMEGKAVLFKKFGGIDAIPLCVNTKDTEEFIKTVAHIAPSFGGINLEDISAPRCFEIEERLKSQLDIPVFHDDQHGTAVVVLAAMINSLKIVNKRFEDITVVINGAGAAGVAIMELLRIYQTKEIIMCDRSGAIHEGRDVHMPPHKFHISQVTNSQKVRGKLADVLPGADVFIGVSEAKLVTKEMVMSMSPNPIIFGLANPIPEIMPTEAKEAGAAVICTGRSDFPNQVNNALVFPGIFRGALDARAKAITEEMKKAAADALASLVSEVELSPNYVIPHIFDKRVASTVAQAVSSVVR